MLKRAFSVFIILMIFCISTYANYATVEISGEKRYKSVRLVPQIYNASNQNLSDISVIDEKGEAVPYFVNSHKTSVSAGTKIYKMSLVNTFIKDEYYYADYVVSNMPNSDVLATSIRVETTQSGFAKKVELFGGYDNTYWENITSDTLYRVNDSKKLSISFSKPLKYTHYRFKILNNLEKVSFTDVFLDYSENVRTTEYFSEEIQADYSVSERDNQTVISIKGMKNVKINTVTIETDSIFKRYASLPNGSGKQLYNLDFNNTHYTDTTLSGDSYASTEDKIGRASCRERV